MFHEEQNGYCKGTKGIGELLYIDQHILNESKAGRKNLAMAWIDYKKGLRYGPQSWIILCLKKYKISNEIIKFIEKTMENWRVELTAGRKGLPEVKIQWDIFHRPYHISSSKTIFYKELKNIKQTLVNNNFPNKLIDKQIKPYLHSIHKIAITTTITILT